MRRTRLVLSGALVSTLGTISLVTLSAQPAPKVDLCHRQGNGGFVPISVGGPAAATHLGHGDAARPNGAAPGGGVFDASCNVVSWTYAVNVVPDPSAIDPASPGNLFVGSGIPATTFGTARNEAEGIELGFQILYRQGPTIASADNYNDDVLEFDAASGPQSTLNGSSVNNLTRAAWNFTFSIATGLNGATTDLDDYTFQLLYDVDPGPGTSYRTLTLEPEGTPQAAGQSGYQWRDTALNLVYMADDEGNATVTQNSQNYAFLHYQFFMGGAYAAPAFPGPGRFDIILQAFDGAQLVASNHVAVNIQP
jgi:hypothetical protein